MSITNLLLWEKWRPRKMDDIILLPRIQKELENGITQHYIFHGHYGTGKTSLARLLIGRYTKKTPFLELNCSIDTSIEVLRNQIDDFCKFNPMFETDSDIKYVFLDEFERVSGNFQDAFKAFLEKYKKVRFIITTNHIGKISDGLKSRIKCINFDCGSLEEEKFLKQEIYKKITNVILPAEEVEIPKADIISIINKKFPDFRSTLVEVQSYIETGSLDQTSSNVSNKIKLELYNSLYNEMSNEECYHFLMNTFGPDRIHILIQLLGRPFVDWVISEKRDNIRDLFKLSYIISDYSYKLETSTDPIILGMTILGKFREIVNP